MKLKITGYGVALMHTHASGAPVLYMCGLGMINNFTTEFVKIFGQTAYNFYKEKTDDGNYYIYATKINTIYPAENLHFIIPKGVGKLTLVQEEATEVPSTATAITVKIL